MFSAGRRPPSWVRALARYYVCVAAAVVASAAAVAVDIADAAGSFQAHFKHHLDIMLLSKTLKNIEWHWEAL